MLLTETGYTGYTNSLDAVVNHVINKTAKVYLSFLVNFQPTFELVLHDHLHSKSNASLLYPL